MKTKNWQNTPDYPWSQFTSFYSSIFEKLLADSMDVSVEVLTLQHIIFSGEYFVRRAGLFTVKDSPSLRLELKLS